MFVQDEFEASKCLDAGNRLTVLDCLQQLVLENVRPLSLSVTTVNLIVHFRTYYMRIMASEKLFVLYCKHVS